MQAESNLLWKKIKRILKDNSGEIYLKSPAEILFIPCGYKFLKNNIEKYGAQLGMLNQLLKKELISDKEHTSIKQNLKKKYSIKE